MDREEEYYIALLREFLRGKDVPWNNSAFAYVELRSFVGRSTMGKRDGEIEPVAENPVYGFIEGWARASRRLSEKYPQQEAPQPFKPWCFGKSAFRNWELFDQDFHVVFADPPQSESETWNTTYAASAITPVDEPPTYLTIVLKPGEMDPKPVRSIVYNPSKPPESYTPVAYVQSNRDLNRLQPFLRAGDITYSTFLVDKDKTSLWQLDRSSDGTSWLKVSNPMPPNPQRIASVMYVRSSKFEEHLQSLASRPVNVRELVNPYRTKSLDDPLVSCVVTMLMNTLFRGNIVPPRPTEWEQAALKRGAGREDSSEKQESSSSVNTWMIISIVAGAIILVGIIVGIFMLRGGARASTSSPPSTESDRPM